MMQELGTYLASIFNNYKKKEDSNTDIQNIKNVLDTVFPDKSTEIQTAFTTYFPNLFPSGE